MMSQRVRVTRDLLPGLHIRPHLNCDKCSSAAEVQVKLAGQYEGLTALEVRAALHRLARLQRDLASLPSEEQEVQQAAFMAVLQELSVRWGG